MCRKKQLVMTNYFYNCLKQWYYKQTGRELLINIKFFIESNNVAFSSSVLENLQYHF